MAEKIYVWRGKTITTQYWDMLWISFNRTDLEKMIANLNEKNWINLNVAPRKDVGKYGETHSITIYKPEAKTSEAKYGGEEIDIDSIPFR